MSICLSVPHKSYIVSFHFEHSLSFLLYPPVPSLYPRLLPRLGSDSLRLRLIEGYTTVIFPGVTAFACIASSRNRMWIWVGCPALREVRSVFVDLDPVLCTNLVNREEIPRREWRVVL